MKVLFFSIITAILASTSIAHNGHRSRSSFGPEIPHKFYQSGSQDGSVFSPVVYFASSSSSSNNDKHITPADASNIAIEYAAKKLNIDPSSFAVTNAYTSTHNQVSHVYLQQVVNDVPVTNGVANVNVDQSGNIISMGSSFFIGDAPPSINDFNNAASPPPGLMQASLVNQANPQFVLTFEEAEKVPEQRKQLSPSEALLHFARHLEIEIDEDAIRHEPILSIMPTESDGPPVVNPHTLHNVDFAIGKTVPASLAYIQVVDGSGQTNLKLVWDLKVEMTDNWFHVHVDAFTGEIHSQVDWVSDATYNVFPLGVNDPNDGNRVTVTDPHHKQASPNGWHTTTRQNYTVTIGNNVYAHENHDGRNRWMDNYRPDGTEDLIFNFPFNEDKEPFSYTDAAVTNLFYWNNIMHDVFYCYGFNEEAGNFQQDNLGNGGRGNDAVIANAQDGSGYNNANFATPPDGYHGKMRMYVWDVVSPMRDGDLESGIIIHEYSHGISIRLTGGPANSGCLSWNEAGGMGEGWGDFFATILRHKETTKRSDVFTMGEYANGGHGIRKYPYSDNMETNPSTYGFIRKPGYWGVHAKGEVWAVILLEAYWELVEKLGFNPDWYSVAEKFTSDEQDTYFDILSGKHKKKPKKGKKKPIYGNILALQLVVDGLKHQPCYPTFVDARDAIIEAAEIGPGQKYVCDLWRGFAKRGLGFGARSGGRESFKMPAKCK